MPLQINSPGWKVKRGGGSRGAGGDAAHLPGLPPEFLTDESRIIDAVILERPASTRGRTASGGLDLTCDVGPGQTAILAIRLASGALTFHQPIQSTRRGSGSSQARFRVTVRANDVRGGVGPAIKAMVISIAQLVADNSSAYVLPKLSHAFERSEWRKRGLKEGWQRVTRASLAAGVLKPGQPTSPDRSLLLLHGPFSNCAGAFHPLAASGFFERIQDTYGDRVFGFDHFTVSRTPEENARMLLEGLSASPTLFDVIAHSRGSLVVRALVEQAARFGSLGGRFSLGNAVLVASPNEGTPVAKLIPWNETIGWIANLLELFPDNPFTTGAAFVANSLVWMANQATGDLPGVQAMDGDGETIAEIQGPPGPPLGAYSALVANYQPSTAMFQRLLDAGFDQIFGSANDLVVPSEGGWRIDRSAKGFIPATRIGCFGPGGNLAPEAVNHLNFFDHTETTDFLVNALLGRPQPLAPVDPRAMLPSRRMLRGEVVQAAARAGEGAGSLPSAPAPAPRGVAAAPLRITVTNGDLRFESEPLLLGHYGSTRLTGTEQVINSLLGGAMEHSLAMGIYPESPGSHQIFINTRSNPQEGVLVPHPPAVIVVGLGDEGSLRAGDITRSVSQAVIAWAQRMAEHNRQGTGVGLAATLMGSGGADISPGEAARLVAEGVFEANTRLKRERSGDATWPEVTHLHFVELYLDRATEAWRTLRMQAVATPGRYEVGPTVRSGTGALQRPADWAYRGVDYDILTVDARGAYGAEHGGEPVIAYSLHTRLARTEVRAVRTQGQLLRDLIATASNDQVNDPQIGRTLFNLLIPVELESLLGSRGDLHIAVDRATAGIPWELLDAYDENKAEQLPWAIRVRLLRRFRSGVFRTRLADADPEESALIVGEPESPPYPRLPGARNEALTVHACLTQLHALDPSRVTALVAAEQDQPGPDARTIVNALLERPWRILHLVGHGAPPTDAQPGGVVLSNGCFLGPSEISSMRVIPELVFVNCCHLPSTESRPLFPYDRVTFAAGLADDFLSIGVRCVVAAGWAVDDEAARVFADEFYSGLIRGNRFVVAVGRAREAAYQHNPDSNTWAAYQCYGDPDWLLRRRAAEPRPAITAPLEDFSGVGSAGSLKLVLERIIVQTRFQGADPKRQQASLDTVEELFGSLWGTNGAVAELFAEAFLSAGAIQRGITWYERAVAAPDGGASLKSAEQLANARGRLAWELVAEAVATNPRKTAAKRTTRTRVAKSKAASDAVGSVGRAVEQAGELFDRATALLDMLLRLEETMERHSLLGAIYKRRAMVEAIAGRPAGENQAIAKMYEHYRRAEELALRSGRDIYYPALNRMAAELMTNAGRRGGWKGFDPREVAAISQSLRQGPPEFWSVAAQTELRMYEAAAEGDLARRLTAIEGMYEDLFARVSAPWMWQSVYDQAMFVLTRYAAGAPLNEQKASAGLLRKLATFARREIEMAESTDSGQEIFISFARADNDLAMSLGAELAKRGHAVVTSVEKLEQADGCVVIVSRSTERPSATLSRQWAAILARKWSESDRSFPLFSVRRQAGAVPPAFLQGLNTVDVLSTGGAGTAAKKIAARVHAAFAGDRA